MDRMTAYDSDRINKIYRIGELHTSLSLCVSPAFTLHFCPICKYLTIHPSKIKFSQGLVNFGLPVGGAREVDGQAIGGKLRFFKLRSAHEG